MVKLVEMYIPSHLTRTRPGRKMNPTSITIHETGNSNVGANALAHARLQVNGNRRQASWHVQVDDQALAYVSIPFNEVAYHTGTRLGNYSSIAIEICVNRDGRYEKALEHAAKVIHMIMKKYPKLKKSDIKQHYHWSRKNCPQRLRSASPISWSQFLSMIDSKNNNQTPSTSSRVGFSVGEKVILKESATTYATGERIPSIYKGKQYTIQQIGQNRLLLKELYSWVFTSDLEKVKTSKTATTQKSHQLTVGSRVQIKTSAKHYKTGEKIPNWVKGKTYTIQQVKGNDILLREIYSWINRNDLRTLNTESHPFKVGGKVKIKQSARTYSRSTVAIPNKYKEKSYTIQQLASTDILIKELYSWVNKKDVYSL